MTVPKISAPVLVFFRRVARRYFKRHFHGVRISGADQFPIDGSPLIIYANHSSWWDPMVSVLLAHRFLRRRKHYAPMDAEALERYGILRRIGIFPIEMKSSRGAGQFLRLGQEILERGGVLWVTPQGGFVDARQRPLEFKPGLAGLARRVAERGGVCTVLPLAIEYPFWDERLPEVLLHLGPAIRLTAGQTADDIQRKLMLALEEAMEELKKLALMRDSTRFQTLIGGTVGSGGFYSIGQRVRAFLLRRPYQREHTATIKPEGMGE
jgi:1-acyl-sn-glycerol-3-phosphate acyltransferase